MRPAAALSWVSFAPALPRARRPRSLAAASPRCSASRLSAPEVDEETAVEETVVLAVSASLVLNTPGSAGAAALSDGALAAYCASKGVRDAGAYAAAVRASREPWDGAAEKARTRLMHQVCNGEGDATYSDPATGYTVFAAIAHLRRGNCCGVPEGGGIVERTHRCRHCPYAPDGSLTSPAYSRLKERIPLVDEVRKRTAKLFGASVRTGGAAIDADGENTESEGDEKEGESRCEECGGGGEAKCRRCKGFMFLISPMSMLCPQCDATGSHPCMSCTPWQPPQQTEFGS